MQGKYLSSTQNPSGLYHQLELFWLHIQVEIPFIRILGQVTEANIVSILVSIYRVLSPKCLIAHLTFFHLLYGLIIDQMDFFLPQICNNPREYLLNLIVELSLQRVILLLSLMGK